MRSLSVNRRLFSDELHHAFWSSEPHRRVELNITFSNDRDERADLASYEVLLPEDAVLDFSADSVPCFSRCFASKQTRSSSAF
jgi:hypothetical protein